jgi:hypothetical protein
VKKKKKLPSAARLARAEALAALDPLLDAGTLRAAFNLPAATTGREAHGFALTRLKLLRERAAQ